MATVEGAGAAMAVAEEAMTAAAEQADDRQEGGSEQAPIRECWRHRVLRSLFFNWVMSSRKMENRMQNGRAERWIISTHSGPLWPLSSFPCYCMQTLNAT